MLAKFGQLKIGSVFYLADKPFVKTSKNGAAPVKPVAIGSIVLNPQTTALIQLGVEVEVYPW